MSVGFFADRFGSTSKILKVPKTESFPIFHFSLLPYKITTNLVTEDGKLTMFLFRSLTQFFSDWNKGIIRVMFLFEDSWSQTFSCIFHLLELPAFWLTDVFPYLPSRQCQICPETCFCSHMPPPPQIIPKKSSPPGKPLVVMLGLPR